MPTVHVTLHTRPPFDGAGLMRFFADHAITGIETGTARSFSRMLRLPHGHAAVSVLLVDASARVPDGTAPEAAEPGTAPGGLDPAPGGLGPASRGHDPASGRLGSMPGGAIPVLDAVAELDDPRDRPHLIAALERLFDLGADSAVIDAALADDPVLAPSVLRHPGVRMPGAADPEEALFRTLIGQQVSVAAARTVLGRVCAELTGGSGLFPTAAEFAVGGAGVLRGPARRVATIIGVAEAVASGALVLDAARPVDDSIDRLLAQPGIGPWTAGYVAMRAFGAADVLLSGDLIMRQSAEALGIPSTERLLARHGRRWAPWRSYAGLHLWKSIGR